MLDRFTISLEMRERLYRSESSFLLGEQTELLLLYTRGFIKPNRTAVFFPVTPFEKMKDPLLFLLLNFADCYGRLMEVSVPGWPGTRRQLVLL